MLFSKIVHQFMLIHAKARGWILNNQIPKIMQILALSIAIHQKMNKKSKIIRLCSLRTLLLLKWWMPRSVKILPMTLLRIRMCVAQWTPYRSTSPIVGVWRNYRTTPSDRASEPRKIRMPFIVPFPSRAPHCSTTTEI